MSQFDPEQWAEVQRLFARAGTLPPEERPGFLERECQDERVRQEVESLLKYPPTGLHTVAAAIAEAAATANPDERLIGNRLGPYKVEAVAGHGGMGAVYRAYRDDGEFRQQVAIKLVRAAAQSPGTLQRFKQERQILARLAHPNIARLLDGGSNPDGVPYLVMEFIEGESITAWCARQSLTIEQRLRLFLRVCEGVEFAHRSLVVHRDLKPGNILVTADGTPKLLDFGIAKMLVPDADDWPDTTIGMRAMTPDYAAPEQVLGEPVTQAVDVYALGLILYELLTGQKAQNIPDPSPGTVALVVCQTAPPAPASLKSELAGDIDNIIRMAIRKEPARRYGSVAQLARDIQLHLEGRPVTARPDTVAYRTGKLLRRHRAMVAGGLIAATLFALAERLGTPGRVPHVIGMRQVTQFGQVGVNGMAADGSYIYFVNRSPGQWKLARVPVEGGSPQPFASMLRNPEILDISPHLAKLLVSDGVGDDVPLWTVPTNGGEPRRIGNVMAFAAAWSPDGNSIAFSNGFALFRVNADGSGLRKLLDLPGRADHLRWSPAPDNPVLRFDLPLHLLVRNQSTTLWEVRTDGTGLHPLLPSRVHGAELQDSNDSGTWIAGGKYYLYRSVSWPIDRIWAMRDGRRFLGLFDQHPSLIPIHSTSAVVIVQLAPTPDGRQVFFVSQQERRQFVRYDATRHEFVPFLPGKPGRWASFSRDGRWMAYTTAPQDALWRSRPDGSEAVQITPPNLHVSEPNWSPDGAWIVCSGFLDGQPPGIFAIPSAGGPPERLASATPAATFAFWSPDGATVLFSSHLPSGTPGRGLYLLDWKTRKIGFLRGSQRWVRGAWSPDARHIAATDGSEIQVFDIRAQSWSPLSRGNGLSPPLWSRNGKYVYYQDQYEPEQPIYRAAVSGGGIERMMTSKQIPQSDLTAYSLVALAPDDSPIATVVRTNSDIHALELELP